MSLFSAKARTRLTRSSTSSNKKKERQIYIYLFSLAVLFVVSVAIVQFALGRDADHTPHDAEHMRKGARGAEDYARSIHMSKGASVAEDLRVGRQKGESGHASIRHEKYEDSKEANRKTLGVMFSLSKDWKTRNAGKRGVGNGWIEEGGGGSKRKEVQYFSDFEGREINLNEENVEDFESGSADMELNEAYTDKARMFQGQQLDDMDKFHAGVATESAYKHQGQILEDMDKFDNHRATEGAIKHQFEDDTVPSFTQGLSDLRDIERNRKYQMVGQNRAEKQAKGIPLVSGDDTRGHLQDGMKESRKLGFRGDSGRDVLKKEKEDEERESFHKIGGSVAGQSGSENRSLLADTVKRNYEAGKGSIRAAIELEMNKRNNVFSMENSMVVAQGSKEQAGDRTGSLNLGVTNPDTSFSHVKKSAEKNNLLNGVGTGMPPLRGFKEYSDTMKDSHRNERLDINVRQSNVKRAGAVIFDEGTSQARRSFTRYVQMGETGIVDSLKLPHVDENKGDITQSSRSAQETAEVHNLDSMNALTMEERESMNKPFDHDENPKVNNEVSQSEESVDVKESDKQLIKKDKLDNVEDIRDVAGEEIKSRETNEGDLDKEKNEVEEESESRKTSEDDPVQEEREDDDHDNTIQWGFHPKISSNLKFSKFLSAFFTQENCSLRIFMAWTTAPWAYTPRHQRVIESILRFHPQACIVVFTETIDFKFFESWVKEGYKIAVARPNLEELLAQTPAIDFAYVWYEWRNMKLFYIHYTELLRIAALHKYGGVWLDMDMILTRPLPKLHNVLGSTVTEKGERVLNGAFMSFDKSSPFLKACIEEYVASYDEALPEWNGADLLNRVASNSTKKSGKEWLEESEHLQVLEPVVLFPLSRHTILRYFSAPRSSHEKFEQEKMLSAILDESHGAHLWNSVTGRHIPEVGSLVDKLLHLNCLRCTDVL